MAQPIFVMHYSFIYQVPTGYLLCVSLAVGMGVSSMYTWTTAAYQVYPEETKSYLLHSSESNRKLMTIESLRENSV